MALFANCSALFYCSFLGNQCWGIAAAAAAKSLQSCLTLCYPIDGSPPGSPIPGILQARTLEWVAISFSNAWKWKVKVKSLSRVRLVVTPWTAAYPAPPSMGFSRQEYWSGLPLPSPNSTLRHYKRNGRWSTYDRSIAHSIQKVTVTQEDNDERMYQNVCTHTH